MLEPELRSIEPEVELLLVAIAIERKEVPSSSAERTRDSDMNSRKEVTKLEADADEVVKMQSH